MIGLAPPQVLSIATQKSETINETSSSALPPQRYTTRPPIRTMPDLNDLLRWSIANSTQPQPPSTDNQLSLRYNPAPNPSGGSSALHTSDPFYRTPQPDDVSTASSPGPTTPVTGISALPGLARRSDLNTDVLDAIMGKSDSALMKEKMAFAVDESKELEDRVSALDDMEMVGCEVRSSIDESAGGTHGQRE